MISWSAATPGSRPSGVQGTARRMAGRAGPVPQPGQDPDRPPDPGVRLPRLEHPPLPQRQAADQAVQGGHQDAPATARGGDAQRCAAPTRRRSSPRSPRHPGLGGLPPGHGLQRGVQLAGRTTCGSSPGSGPGTRTRTSRGAGSRPGTSASSTRPGRTSGCSATGKPAPTCASTPGRESAGTSWSRARHPPTTPAWQATGGTAGTSTAPRWTAAPCSCSAGNGACCPLCGDRLIDSSHLPGSPEEWQDWWLGVTQRTIERAPSTPGQQPGTANATTTLIHAFCYRALQDSGAGTRHCNPQRPSGLPEPDAGKLARPVLRGPGPQQCAPATRRTSTAARSP